MRATILAIGFLTLVAAPAAVASTAEMRDAYLVYRAGDGELNRLSIVHSEDGLITVTDTGAVIQAMNGCVPKDVHVAECGHESLPENSDLLSHSVSLGDQDDSFEVFGLQPGDHTDYSVSGDAGDDILLGGTERDFLEGGDGADRLEGGGSDDTLIGGPGADVMRGGLGIDTATYFHITKDVRVEIGNGPGDGEPGEGDDVQTENVEGGSGDDVLIGNIAANKLDGGPGADVLSGRGGGDELFTGSTDDPSVADLVRCGKGIDTATLSGPDAAPDNCEQVAHGTLMRLSVTALERSGHGRLRAAVRRQRDEDDRAAVTQAELFIPCGPLRADGTRCWRRVGRSRIAQTIDSDDSAVVPVVLSHVGRRWLRNHPHRRPRLTAAAHIQDAPDQRVELRLRVRIPGA